MARWILLLLAVLVGVSVIGAGYALFSTRSLTVTQVNERVYMFAGLGGNVGVLRTGAGTVLVDTMTFQMQGELIREEAEALTGEPVVMVINTHYHFDHTHGNPAFADNVRIIATQKTQAYLQRLDAESFATAGMPNETFVDEYRVRVGDQTIRLIHPGRGHTDGDLIAYFEDQQIAHLGDLYFNRLYPNIDLEAGGSVRLWPATLERVLELPMTHVIPGHGALSDVAGVRQFQAFLSELAALGAAAAKSGRSLEDTLAQARLNGDAGYQPPVDLPFLPALDRDFVVRRAWQEATGAVKPP